jgi:hypothetical protein
MARDLETTMERRRRAAVVCPRLCNLRSGNSVGGTAKLRLLGIPYSWSSIHPGGAIAPQET